MYQIDLIFMSYLAIALQGIAAVSSILSYNNYKTTWLKIMPLFLSYSFINEMVGIWPVGAYNNTFAYNIYSIIAFIYFLIVYYQYSVANKFKRIIGISILLYITSVIINMAFQDITSQSLLYSYCLGGGFIIIAILFYFVEKLSSTEILHLKVDLLFWISVGLLLFYSGYIPIKLTRISYTSFDDHYNTIRFVHLLLVLIMNGLFTIGFIWNRKK